MARSKPSWQVMAEYYPLAGFFWLMGILPWRLSVLMSQSLLRIVLFCLPKRRQLIDENLSQAFPDRNLSAREQIAETCLMNIGRGLTVLARIPRLSPHEWNDLIDVEGLEYAQEALSHGKGAITFTAHYGCWEAMAVYLMRKIPSAIVVRPFDNPKVEALMTGVRDLGGGRIIPKHRAMAQGLRALKDNLLLGILIDQNFAPGRLFVDFFNRPAATTPIVSLLARRTGCPVLPLHNSWENGRVRIIFEPPITLSPNPTRHLAVAEDTQAMTRIVEGWVRKDPSQWFWLHHRWKRQPQPQEFVFSEASAPSYPPSLPGVPLIDRNS